MKVFLICIGLVISLSLVAGRAAAQQSIEPQITKRIASEKRRDSALESAIILGSGITEDDDKDTRYYYNYIDLNGDGVREVLVYIFGGYFCGTGGCDAYLYRQTKGKYELVSRFGPVRNPIIVGNSKSNGWNDLVFFNRGGGMSPGYYSVVRFDGKAYPENPTVEDVAPRLRYSLIGTAYLVGSGYENSGLRFNFKRDK